MDHIDEFRASPDWQYSVGLPVTKAHFREAHGTRHAVCDYATGECVVHEDTANPHYDLAGHLIHDAPEILTGLAVTVASAWLWKKRKLLPF